MLINPSDGAQGTHTPFAAKLNCCRSSLVMKVAMVAAGIVLSATLLAGCMCAGISTLALGLLVAAVVTGVVLLGMLLHLLRVRARREDVLAERELQNKQREIEDLKKEIQTLRELQAGEDSASIASSSKEDYKKAYDDSIDLLQALSKSYCSAIEQQARKNKHILRALDKSLSLLFGQSVMLKESVAVQEGEVVTPETIQKMKRNFNAVTYTSVKSGT